MAKTELFLDPSILFNKRSLDNLDAIRELRDFHFVTSGEFSPATLRDVSGRDFGGMQRRYAGWLREASRPSREVIAAKTESLSLSYFSVALQELRRAPDFFDPDRLEREYQRGWNERADIDELWFLATHSTVLSRLKKREQDLALRLYRLLRKGLSTSHLTIQPPTRTDQEDLQTLADVGRWLVWIVGGAAAAGLIPPLVPWVVAGPLILSFKI